jgi:hypothetical protein
MLGIGALYKEQAGGRCDSPHVLKERRVVWGLRWGVKYMKGGLLNEQVFIVVGAGSGNVEDVEARVVREAEDYEAARGWK